MYVDDIVKPLQYFYINIGGTLMLVSLNTQPIIIDKKLAAKIGLNEAVVLCRIHHWLESNRIQVKIIIMADIGPIIR